MAGGGVRMRLLSGQMRLEQGTSQTERAYHCERRYMIEFMQHALETDNSAILASLRVRTTLTAACVWDPGGIHVC